jgi:hypothetical protein
MVLHYVVGAQYPTGHDFMGNVTLWWACPWTLSTAVVLGGALCMIAIGAVHTALARYAVLTVTPAVTVYVVASMVCPGPGSLKSARHTPTSSSQYPDVLS